MKKSHIIAAVCLILVAVLSLVYLFVFDKEEEKEVVKVVKISGVKEGTSEGVKTNDISFENTSISIKVALEHPGANISYVVTIKNEKANDVTLKTITGIEAANNNDPQELIYEVSDIEVGDVIKAGESKDVTIKALWKDTESTLGEVTKDTTITFTFE